MNIQEPQKMQESALNIAEFLGQDVEAEGIEMMQAERVVPFGTALWP